MVGLALKETRQAHLANLEGAVLMATVKTAIITVIVTICCYSSEAV